MSVSIWPNTADIDGLKNCEGCFTQREQRRENINTGESDITAICTWEMPKCHCPPCRIFCDTEITNIKDPTGMVIFSGVLKASTLGVSDDPSCVKWYLEESCATC